MPEKIHTNYKEALRISKAAIEMKQRGAYPFNLDKLYPDAHIPKKIEEIKEKEERDKEHALFLFHSVSLDSMERAERVYAAVEEILNEIGTLSQVHKIGEERLEKLIEKYLRTGKMSNPVRTIIENSSRLEKDYQSNPLNLEARTIRRTLENISIFHQYGIPKAALLMKNFVRYNMWNFPESDIPVKVDRHILRMSLSCGVIDAEKYSTNETNWEGKLSVSLKKAKEKMMRQGYFTKEDFNEKRVRMIRRDKLIIPLTNVYQRVTKREHISAIELDDALWAIGAYLCKLNNAITCSLQCGINCSVRFPSDNNAVYFFLGVDKRRDKDNLFSYASQHK